MTRSGDRREDRCSKPSTRKFTNFTPLTTLIDQVLIQIKDDTTLTWLGKLKGDPSKRSRDKYCGFHWDHSHDTSECYDWNQQIETPIRQRKLNYNNSLAKKGQTHHRSRLLKGITSALGHP